MSSYVSSPILSLFIFRFPFAFLLFLFQLIFYIIFTCFLLATTPSVLPSLRHLFCSWFSSNVTRLFSSIVSYLDGFLLCILVDVLCGSYTDRISDQWRRRISLHHMEMKCCKPACHLVLNRNTSELLIITIFRIPFLLFLFYY